MKKVLNSVVVTIFAMLISIGFVKVVYGQNLNDMGIVAGAHAVIEGPLSSEGFIAGADKAEDVAFVESIMSPELVSINEVISPKQTSLDAEDPLFALFGEDLVMSNVKDSVNVRKEPSEDSDLVGKLYHNCAGEMTYQKDGWTKIKSGELSGWVKDDYLIFEDEAVALAKQAGAYMATVTTDTLRIREAPDANSAIYGLLGKGEKIEVTDEPVGDWVKVSYSDETEGYISSEFVTLDYEIDEGETIAQIKEREAKEAAKKEKERQAKIAASRTTTTTTTNNGGIAAQTDDVTLLAALIQAECGREVYAGKLAVGAVVVNRARGRYGSIFNAVYAPGQFGPAASGKVAVIAAMGPTAECRKAASEAISGVSNIGSATHFRNIRSGYAGIVIGNHVFW